MENSWLAKGPESGPSGFRTSFTGSFAGQEFVVIEVIANPTTDFPHSPRAESPEMLVLKGFSCHAHVE